MQPFEKRSLHSQWTQQSGPQSDQKLAGQSPRYRLAISGADVVILVFPELHVLIHHGVEPGDLVE